MTKINSTIKKETKFDTTTQLAGGYGAFAAKQGAEELLRRAVMACLLWEDLFYESAEDNSENISNLIPLVRPETVCEIAIEARVDQKLRHVPLFIASEMLKHWTHKQFVAELLPKIITRPDQITDFLAIYWKNGKKPLAAQIKKGLASCFHNFNEYQFAKYDRDAPVKLRDVMRLVHPRPKDQVEKVLFKNIVDRTLKTPDTWEVALSAGNDKKETWTRLITENKLGALAFLRNLRNMIQADVDHNVIRKGFESIKSSWLLPINFLSAVQYADVFKNDIEKMMIRTYSELPKLPGYTIFVVDVSGSMGSMIGGKSKFGRMQVAEAMAILAANQCEKIDIYCTAGNDSSKIHKTEKIKYPEKGFGLMNQIETMRGRLGGGGIFTRQCLEYIKADVSQVPDRIIIFSDSQDCDAPEKRTPRPFGSYNYIVDVSAHSRGINYKGVWTSEISGWSDHFLTYIASLEGIQNVFDDEQ